MCGVKRFGRDNFQEATKIAHRMDHMRVNWNAFKYMVFDLPTSKGSYSERYAQLCTYIYPTYMCVSARPRVTHYCTTITTSATALGNKNRKYVSLAPYVVCKDTSHFEELYQDIIDQGGEGVILRDPLSPYQSGRSTGYLKHKVSKREEINNY